jgi:DNA invertase Pin-like site-specific DNA recombinase
MTTTKRRLAIYCRVSTGEQTVEPQLLALRQYAEARGFETVKEYADNGISGTKDRRPGLDQLLADARRRRFDAVAVVKLDRLARSVRHLVVLTGELEALGVDLVVLDQGLDTSTPSGRLLFHVLGAIAEFERDLIVERTKAGLEVARKKGKRFGRPPVTDRRQRERILRLRTKGHSLRSIVELTGVSKTTVLRVLDAAA